MSTMGKIMTSLATSWALAAGLTAAAHAQDVRFGALSGADLSFPLTYEAPTPLQDKLSRLNREIGSDQGRSTDTREAADRIRALYKRFHTSSSTEDGQRGTEIKTREAYMNIGRRTWGAPDMALHGVLGFGLRSNDVRGQDVDRSLQPIASLGLGISSTRQWGERVERNFELKGNCTVPLSGGSNDDFLLRSANKATRCNASVQWELKF